MGASIRHLTMIKQKLVSKKPNVDKIAQSMKYSAHNVDGSF